jgi:Protein of unknown function (DUF551).
MENEFDVKKNLELATELSKCADGDNSGCLRDVQHHCRQRLMHETAQALARTTSLLQIANGRVKSLNRENRALKAIMCQLCRHHCCKECRWNQVSTASKPEDPDIYSDWTAVSDGLPGEQLVLVSRAFHDYALAEYRAGGIFCSDDNKEDFTGYWWSDAYGELSGVTHWMPLPKGPEDENK